MKILHFDTGVGWRGGQQQVLWLMEGLRMRGHEQTLIAVEGSPLAETMRARDFPVETLHSSRNSLANLRAVRSVASRFDLIHAHDARAHTLAWLSGTGRRRSAWPVLVVSRRVGFPMGRFGTRKYAAADGYLAISDFVRQRLLRAKVPSAKIHVVYDGVEPPRQAAPGERAEFRQRYGLGDDALLIGTLTSLAPEKRLIEELELLAELPRSSHLWIGHPAAEPPHGEAEAELAAYAKKHRIADRFRIIPLESETGTFLDSLDIFLYLSKAEGLGSAILLAMAHRLPVVASRVGGIPEIVRDRETGLLVGENLKGELPRAVRFLLESEQLRSKLGSAARKFVMENATTERMVSVTLAAYERILDEHRRLHADRSRPSPRSPEAREPGMPRGKG